MRVARRREVGRDIVASFESGLISRGVRGREKDGGSEESVSRIPATLNVSLPTSLCNAKTIPRCSEV